MKYNSFSFVTHTHTHWHGVMTDEQADLTILSARRTSTRRLPRAPYYPSIHPSIVNSAKKFDPRRHVRHIQLPYIHYTVRTYVGIRLPSAHDTRDPARTAMIKLLINYVQSKSLFLSAGKSNNPSLFNPGRILVPF